MIPDLVLSEWQEEVQRLRKENARLWAAMVQAVEARSLADQEIERLRADWSERYRSLNNRLNAEIRQLAERRRALEGEK